MMKRENGTGTVYKWKTAKRRPWVAVAPARYEMKAVNGVRTVVVNRMVIGHYATRSQAQDALDAFLQAPTDSFNITLAELYDEWRDIAFRTIGKQTQDNYTAAWKRLGVIAECRVRDIRTSPLQRIIDDNAEMSASSLSKIKALMTQLFDYAMQNDIVNKNYAKFVSLPREEKKAKEVFSEIELKKILNAAGTVPFADVVAMMCYTGFRLNEFLSLTRFSYDSETRTLTGGMKTNAGRNRVVPIHPSVQPFFDEWLAKGGETIVCDEFGKRIADRTFREQYYYTALEAIGVRRLSPHSTRHTFATRLAAAGARVEDIQALAGHEDYSVTANTYIHQSVDTLRSAIEKMA